MIVVVLLVVLVSGSCAGSECDDRELGKDVLTSI